MYNIYNMFFNRSEARSQKSIENSVEVDELELALKGDVRLVVRSGYNLVVRAL